MAVRSSINPLTRKASTARAARRSTAAEPYRTGRSVAAWLAIAAGLALCFSSRPAATEVDVSQDGVVVRETAELAGEIERVRAAKDSMFREGEGSPLTAADRGDFDGLSYYPVDLQFRLVGDMHRYGRQRRVLIPTTADTLVPMVRFGRLVLQFAGNPFWLEVYGNPETRDLSVFFTDATNGSTTYAGGRYAPVRDLGSGSYLIDFNESYSPYCAYNTAYICPLPPPQNRLTFAVAAGERVYGPDLADPHGDGE